MDTTQILYNNFTLNGNSNLEGGIYVEDSNADGTIIGNNTFTDNYYFGRSEEHTSELQSH